MNTNMPLPHPGEVVKHDCLDELGLNVTDAANVLGVTRNTLSRIINGRAGMGGGEYNRILLALKRSIAYNPRANYITIIV